MSYDPNEFLIKHFLKFKFYFQLQKHSLYAVLCYTYIHMNIHMAVSKINLFYSILNFPFNYRHFIYYIKNIQRASLDMKTLLSERETILKQGYFNHKTVRSSEAYCHRMAYKVKMRSLFKLCNDCLLQWGFADRRRLL